MKRRIVISLGLLLALCLMGTATALYSLNESIKGFGELAELQRVQALRASLNLAGLRVERDLLAELNGVEGSEDALLESVSHFRDSLRHCSSCHHVPEVEARIGGVNDSFELWLEHSRSTIGMQAPADEDPGGDVSLRLLSRVIEETEGMIDPAEESLAAKAKYVKAIVQRAWVTMCLTLLAVLIAGGAIAVNLHRNLTRPLVELFGLLDEVRDGDPEKAHPVSGDEEFRHLGNALVHAYGELKGAEKSVLEAQKMAAIGQLAAGVAHEVLNPLTGISCLVQTLEREERTETDQERLALIKDHIARITKIVGEFQHFSLPSRRSGRALVSATELLEQALELLSYDKRTAGVEISLDAEQGLAPLHADASRLGVVFTNLALNAVWALKESGTAEPKLEVSARREGSWLVIRFSDNGPGMAEMDKASAFEPFFTTKPAGEGTGLGLWVCYEAVRGHGGRIALLDRPGGGLEVKVELPYDET